jgi:hypothetical protein
VGLDNATLAEAEISVKMTPIQIESENLESIYKILCIIADV